MERKRGSRVRRLLEPGRDAGQKAVAELGVGAKSDAFLLEGCQEGFPPFNTVRVETSQHVVVVLTRGLTERAIFGIIIFIAMDCLADG